MKTTVRMLTILGLLCVFSGANCHMNRIHNTDLISPVVFHQPPSLQEVAATINNNTAQVQRLQATSATLNVRGPVPSLRTSLALERPLRFRLQAGTGFTGTELDLGSNDDLFWFWAKHNNPPAMYFGRHQEFSNAAARGILPVPPTWLIEALGLVTIDSNGVWDGPYAREPSRLEIRGQVASPAGMLTKVLVVDDRRGFVVEQHLYDETGQLLASAIGSLHEFDSQHRVTLPRRIDIQLPPAQLAFSLEIDEYQVNQLRGDPSQLWMMPQPNGASMVPLTGQGVATVGYHSGDEFMPR